MLNGGYWGSFTRSVLLLDILGFCIDFLEISCLVKEQKKNKQTNKQNRAIQKKTLKSYDRDRLRGGA